LPGPAMLHVSGTLQFPNLLPAAEANRGSRWQREYMIAARQIGDPPEIYRRVNVTCVTPVGVLTASTSKRSSSPSSPSQRRSPRPRTMGAMTMCM
jgi:hypothetical protein